jgi:hypothetical protein
MLERMPGHATARPDVYALSSQWLQSLHDDLLRRTGRDHAWQCTERFLAHHGTEHFPPPPVPGSPTIRPITTITALVDEGRRMHHCVASRTSGIMSGRRYYYSVHRPERATLEIVYTNKGYQLAEIRLARDAIPCEGTIAVARRWLTDALVHPNGRGDCP